MNLWLHFFFQLLIGFSLCNTVWCQVVIPPENAGGIDSALNVLSYPENFDRALLLLKKPDSGSQSELSEYYGLQALSWAKENKDNPRAYKAVLALADFFALGGQYMKMDSFYNVSLNFAETDEQKADVFLNKARILLRTSEFENWDTYLKEARRYIADDTLSDLMAKYHFNKGLYLFEAKQDFVGAIFEYQTAKKLNTDDADFINVVNYNLANIYGQIELFDKVEELVEDALVYARETNDVYGELFSLYGLGYAALELGKLEKLKATCDQAFALRENTGISTAFGYAYYLLGEYYLGKGQLDSAFQIFQAGLDLSERREEEKALVDCLGGMLRVKLAGREYEEAAGYGERALSLDHRPDHQIEKHLAAVYQEMGRYEDAYELLKTYNDKSNAEELKRSNILITTKLLEDRFEQDKQQTDLAYQQNLSQQRFRLLVMTILIVIALGLVAFALQARSRRKLKVLNESLLESNQSLKQFAYITSHDLKEPVRNITSFSNLLSRRLSEKENTADEKDFLTFITSNAIVLKEIIDSLQIFTTISFGKIEKEKVELNTVFEVLKSSLQQTIEEKNGLLSFHNPQEIEEIYFSRSMLILVLQNLILNGFKYNQSPQPKVAINVSTSRGKTLFEVKDNGEGIESEYFEKIFTPFKTLKNKSITQSSGLGLSICKNILERYDGRVWVESDGKTGSTFSFII